MRATFCIQCLRRSPLLSTNPCILFGKALQSPSTFKLSLMSWQNAKEIWPSRDPHCQACYQHKLESRSRNTSVLWQAATRNCQDRYQHKLEYRSRNTSVLWQAVTCKCQDRYQHKLEYRSRNTSVLLQTATRNCQDGYWVPVTKRLGIVADRYRQLSGRLPT